MHLYEFIQNMFARHLAQTRFWERDARVALPKGKQLKTRHRANAGPASTLKPGCLTLRRKAGRPCRPTVSDFELEWSGARVGPSNERKKKIKTRERERERERENKTVRWPKHLMEKRKGIYRCRIEKEGKLIYVRDMENALF